VDGGGLDTTPNQNKIKTMRGSGIPAEIAVQWHLEKILIDHFSFSNVHLMHGIPGGWN
jgi:hypothetical protein